MLPSSGTQKALQTLAILTLLLPSCGRAQPGETAPAPIFTFDSSGATPVLTAEFRPGMTMQKIQFEVFGEGRVIVTIRNAGGAGEVLARDEIRVAPERIEQTLDRAIRAGIGDFDNKAVEAEIHAAGRFPRLPTDLGSVALTLLLETYQRTGEAAQLPYVHSIVVTEPRAMAKALPDVHEYQALASLVEFLDECYRTATVSKKTGPGTRQPPASTP